MRYHRKKRPETDGLPIDDGLSGRAREAERILSRSLEAARAGEPGTATPLVVVRTVVEADDLVEQAQAIGDPARMSQANLTTYLSLLSDAIGVDPGNERAQTLYNEALLTAENAPTVRPMSPASRQLFQAAQDDYAAARTADAIRKVNQLWQDTPNRLDPDLVAFRESLKIEFPDLIQDEQ